MYRSSINLRPWLYLALPLLAIALFFYGPLLQTLLMSLQDFSENLYAPSWVGLKNYGWLLSSGDFWNSLRNTLLLMLGILPAILTLPIAMALLVNQPLPGVGWFRTIIYIPVLLSMVVVGLAWKWLLSGDGLINAGLRGLGLEPVPWLTQPDWALLAIIIVVVWKALAYYMMLYLAQLQTVNAELYQAAELDGANLWQRHWHVTLPHLRPTMLLVLVIGSIGCLKLFTEVYVLTRGGPLHGTETLVYYVYKKAFEQLDLGMACAAGLVLAGFLFCFSWLQLKVFSNDTAAQGVGA